MDLVDLAMPDPGTGDNLPLTATGDGATVTGLASVRQRALAVALTDPGDVVWAPNFGGGVRAMRGRLRAELTADAARLERALLSDPRIERVDLTVPALVQSPNRTTLEVSIQTVDDATVGVTFTV